jgi:predicted transcriptional regulator
MSVVSVRVDEKVKKKLEAAGVDVPAEVRKRLEELAWQVELKERMARLEKTLKDMPPAAKGFSARSVREDRESH